MTPKISQLRATLYLFHKLTAQAVETVITAACSVHSSQSLLGLAVVMSLCRQPSILNLEQFSAVPTYRFPVACEFLGLVSPSPGLNTCPCPCSVPAGPDNKLSQRPHTLPGQLALSQSQGTLSLYPMWVPVGLKTQ